MQSCHCIVHDSIQSIGIQLRWEQRSNGMVHLATTVAQPRLAQKQITPLPEKLTEKDPCCKACPASVRWLGGKEWEVLLVYRGAALGCVGSRGAGSGAQLALVAQVTRKQILREAMLKLGLLFTAQITKCRPPVLLGLYYTVHIRCQSSRV